MEKIINIDLVETPIGILTIGAFDSGSAAFVLFEGNEAPMGSVRNPRPCSALKKELVEYFAGKRTNFTVSYEIQGSEFTVAVLRALASVPYGTTVTYGELAAIAGYPQAARAVGTVMAKNPLPIVLPCHRVLPAGGGVGNYGGGSEVKRFLLRLEGVNTV
ncbi:MAG TPA: methylated-DNA--[protein]-cysteine S-methyltransferase [Spirochaetia bacterium]|nr:methylated-DNA--[protein]-cysteine S-methyltransferase [Spirochaetia bacterium]